MIIFGIYFAKTCSCKATINGIKVNGEGSLEVVFWKVKIKINGIAVAAIDIDARADCREFVGGVLGADIVPPGLGAEDGGPEIIGSADIRASDGVEDQSEDAATVISNRSTDRGLAGVRLRLRVQMSSATEDVPEPAVC